MNLPKLADMEISGKRVIVRADLDVEANDKTRDIRLEVLIPTLKYLIDKKAKIIIIGHRGRPEGKIDNNLSLKKVSEQLSKLLGVEIKFIYDIAGVEAKTETQELKEGEVVMLENLRFDSREESCDETFAKSLSELADIYINESFATSHRKHASIVGIPKFIPHVAGLRFEQEVEKLSRVFESPDHPLLIILSGVKKDKVGMIEPLAEIADKVLIGGRLPEYMGDQALESIRLQDENKKVIVGNLNMDKEDITLNTIERFTSEIAKARMIVLAGVLGKYEDEGHRQGTEKVFKAVADSSAFKIVGGGDSLNAILMYELENKFDWVSVGGGAMIEFLTTKNLPGIAALG